MGVSGTAGCQVALGGHSGFVFQASLSGTHEATLGPCGAEASEFLKPLDVPLRGVLHRLLVLLLIDLSGLDVLKLGALFDGRCLLLRGAVALHIREACPGSRDGEGHRHEGSWFTHCCTCRTG